MSNIVVPEERILELEDIRIDQRTRLRSQGVGCKDNEDLGKLVKKTSDVQSWNSYLVKTTKGILIDTNLITTVTNSQFENFRQAEGFWFESATSVGERAFSGCDKATFVYLPSATTINMYRPFYNSPMLKYIVVPSGANYTQNNNPFSAPTLCDVGLMPSVPYSLGNGLNYLILRSSSLAPLSSASNVRNGAKIYVPNSLVSTYENATNWSSLTDSVFISIEGSRFENLDWFEDFMNKDGTLKATCTLDGNTKEVNDDETVAIFKHTENITHCYENGVELQDTDLVKGKTLTSTI